jgi:hypothetical protein
MDSWHVVKETARYILKPIQIYSVYFHGLITRKGETGLRTVL